MNDFISVNQPLFEGNEKKYLAECIDTGWISSDGPFVKRFEKEFSLRMGRKHGIAVTNGTAALDVAIEALGIGKGDEVILPTFTIISCILQIIRSGAIPVLIESDPETWNMDVNQIEAKITSRTKAIMVVHTYGLPVNMNTVLDICKKYDLKLIEDAAEQIGQCYKGRPCGSFGDISTVSFYANKHITAGEGGMILTNDDTLAMKCQELRNLCFQSDKRFIHEKLGWNLRMTNLQAAVGVAQLEQLDKFLEKKRWIGNVYNNLLSDLKEVQLPLKATDYADNIYWVYGLTLKNSVKFEASEIIKHLFKLKIGCRPFFYPMHQQPILKKLGFFQGEKYPIAEKLYQRGFYIPSGLALNENELKKVANTLKNIFLK
jgi:perosamine synthetase